MINLTIRDSFSIPVFRFQMDGIIAPVFGPTTFSITLIQDIGSEVPVNEYSPFIIRILIPSFKRTFVVLQIQVGNVFTDSVRDNCRFKGINRHFIRQEVSLHIKLGHTLVILQDGFFFAVFDLQFLYFSRIIGVMHHRIKSCRFRRRPVDRYIIFYLFYLLHQAVDQSVFVGVTIGRSGKVERNRRMQSVFIIGMHFEIIGPFFQRNRYNQHIIISFSPDILFQRVLFQVPIYLYLGYFRVGCQYSAEDHPVVTGIHGNRIRNTRIKNFLSIRIFQIFVHLCARCNP